MRDCERYPHIEPDHQARAEEHECREERRLHALHNAWKAYHEPSTEENPPVEPKPAAGERIQMDPGFSKSA